MIGDETGKNKKQTDPMALLPGLVAISSRKAEEQKEQYSYYYNRIYPLLKDGRLDFPKIADKTGFKERRIRETLLFRLTSNEVMQLFGRKEGFCYICNNRLSAIRKTEPMCLQCLQTLDTAIQEIQLEAPPASPLSEQDELAFEQQLALDSHGHPATPPPVQFVSVGGDSYPEPEQTGLPDEAQLQTLLNELNLYRQKYGPLVTPSTPDASSPEQHNQESLENQTSAITEDIPLPNQNPIHSTENTSEKDETQKAQPVATSDFLDILSLDDCEIKPSLGELSGILPNTGESLRQYGFQRLKHPGTR